MPEDYVDPNFTALMVADNPQDRPPNPNVNRLPTYNRGLTFNPSDLKDYMLASAYDEDGNPTNIEPSVDYSSGPMFENLRNWGSYLFSPEDQQRMKDSLDWKKVAGGKNFLDTANSSDPRDQQLVKDYTTRVQSMNSSLEQHVNNYMDKFNEARNPGFGGVFGPLLNMVDPRQDLMRSFILPSMSLYSGVSGLAGLAGGAGTIGGALSGANTISNIAGTNNTDIGRAISLGSLINSGVNVGSGVADGSILDRARNVLSNTAGGGGDGIGTSVGEGGGDGTDDLLGNDLGNEYIGDPSAIAAANPNLYPGGVLPVDGQSTGFNPGDSQGQYVPTDTSVVKGNEFPNGYADDTGLRMPPPSLDLPVSSQATPSGNPSIADNLLALAPGAAAVAGTATNDGSPMTGGDQVQYGTGTTTTPSNSPMNAGDGGFTSGYTGGSTNIFDTFLNKLSGSSVQTAIKAAQILAGVASGVRGVNGSNNISPTAAQNMADPFASSRQQYIDKLNALMANPSLTMSQPGYQFALQQGMQGLNRNLSKSGMSTATPGFPGTPASGAAGIAQQVYGQNFALKSYNDYVNQLSALSGATQRPSAGSDAYLNAQKAASEAASAGWKSIGQASGGLLDLFSGKSPQSGSTNAPAVGGGAAGGSGGFNLSNMNPSVNYSPVNWNDYTPAGPGFDGTVESSLDGYDTSSFNFDN
jgi:hypothetical protein